jgi:hypothetical protein
MIIDKIFKKSVIWLFSEAVVYQLLFIAHQFVLLNVVGSGLYGLAGAVFGLVYLLISCLLFGFENLLARTFQANAYYKARSLTKISASSYTITKTMITVLGLFYGQVLFILGAIILLNLIISFLPNLVAGISLKYSAEFFAALSNLKLIFWGTVFFEALHKMLRNTALLLGHAFSSAILEFASLVIYLLCVWGQYYISGQLDLGSLLWPLFFQALLTCIFYIIIIQSSLSFRFSDLLLRTRPVFGDLLIRAQGFMALQARGIISGNLLSTLTALIFGFSAASFVKVVSLVTSSFFSLAERFTLLSLGRLKDRHSLSSLAIYITRFLAFVWAATSLIFIIYFLNSTQMPDVCNQLNCSPFYYWLIIFSYLIMTGVELYAYPYEKIALARRHGYLVSCLFILSLAVLFTVLQQSQVLAVAIFVYMVLRSLLLLSFVYYFKQILKAN